jgi:hypothetical protein
MIEETETSPDEANVANELQIGATVTPLYVKRQMKVYAIHGHEIDTLSLFNATATTCFTIAAFIASAGLSIWINRIFYADLTPAGIVASYYVAPGLIVLALIFVIIGIVAICKRRSTWNMIKSESRAD